MYKCNFQISKTLLLFMAMFSLGGCGGDTTAPNVGESNVRFTVLQSLYRPDAVADVAVSIYNTDNRTIKSTVTTGADGVADFGLQPGNQVSVTLAYVKQSGQNVVRTLLDIDSGDYTFYLDDSRMPCSNKNITINLTNVNVTDVEVGKNVSVTFGNQFGDSLNTFTPGTGQTFSKTRNFCLDTNNLDQTLVVFHTTSNENGFYTPDEFLTMTVDLTAAAPTINADFSALVNYTNISSLLSTPASLKVELEFYTPDLHHFINGYGTSGALVMGQDLSTLADRYIVEVSDQLVNTGDNMVTEYTRYGYDAFPGADIAIDRFPGAISSVSYNEGSSVLSYQGTGAVNADYVEFVISDYEYNGLIATTWEKDSWTITAPTSYTQLPLMELPPLAANWFDYTNLFNWNLRRNIDYGVRLVDLDGVTDYNSAINTRMRVIDGARENSKVRWVENMMYANDPAGGV
ncbi:MAG: hypothetical protein OEZ68_15535 [Gammaproteobacteria bacterium]|nr:hypothetical protein [Gammaproteobacteria bacterium]MDH5802214.1 hypothetical protein [Gammaproteobacteria bacterium]